MDRIAAIRVFVTVAELHGFAAAARKLQVSAPAVTRMIAALEDQLTIRLLQRTTRSVSLTEAGARYLERARRILGELDEAEREARAKRITPAGRFVVTAPAVFGRREVAPLVCELLARYPAVNAELVLADRVVDLVEEGVDVAVRIGALADSTLHARAVGSTRRCVVASPAYLASCDAIRRPLDLAKHPVVQVSSLQSPWTFGSRAGEIRVAVSPRLVTNSAEAAIAYALAGNGPAMVLSYQVRDALIAGTLVRLLERGEPPPLPIQIVYPAARLPSATLRAFIELAVKTRRWAF